MYWFLYFLILTSFIFSRGFYTFSGVILLLTVCLLFPFVFMGKLKLNLKILNAKTLFILLPVLSIVVYGGLYQQNEKLVILSYILLVINLLLSIRLLSELQKFKTFIFIFLIMILLRLFMIWSSPVPYIDVYDYLYKGALGFLSGANPYSMTYTKLYADFTPNYYGYLPGMLFATLPFVAILGDPRYTFVLAEIITALVVFKLLKDKKEKYLYPLLVLNNPVSLYLIEQSYTESLIVMLFALVAYLLVRKKFIISGLVYGFLIATKQYIFFTIPLLLRWVMPGRKKIIFLLFAALVSFMLILPFMVWNPADFLQDAVFLQGQFPPRYESLSFFSYLNRIGIPFNMQVAAVIIGGFWGFIFLQNKLNSSRLFLLLSFLYLVFFYFNKWAFINYYYLCTQLLLIGGILDDAKL